MAGSPPRSWIGPILFAFTGSGVGGSHVSTLLLCRALDRDHGIEAMILAPAGSGIVDEAKAWGLPVVTTPGPPARRRETLRDLFSFAGRRRILKAYGANAILHCCDLWTLQAWGPAAKSLGLRLVYHHRDFIKGRRRDRLLLSLADKVISISEACSRNFGRQPAGRLVNIVNPFEAPAARETFREARTALEARWPASGLKLVGFSGNFAKRKRADFFVEMAAAVAAREPAARFVVFGRDRAHTATELTRLAEARGVADRILFAGFQSPPERNLAPLDLLAAPAVDEPFGRTLLEAALLGVPYVATDDAGHSEIAKRWGGGRLAARDATPEAFAEKVLEVLADPQSAALRPERRTALAEELHPAAHAAKVIEVYRSLARNPTR
jgi:glycosyltransferase involved in cell wall biosynthesis